MRYAVAVMVVAACSSPEDRVIGDIDVVVSSSSVRVYPQGDLSCEVSSGGDRVFPALGECAPLSDGIATICPADTALSSCLYDVAVDGVPARVVSPTDLTRAFVIPATVTPSSVLALRGCGIDAEIPISADAAPTPTLTAAFDETSLEVSATWTADQPIGSTLVTTSYGLGGKLCHVATSAYSFTWFGELPTILSIDVETLSVPTVTTHGSSEIRVWAGNATGARLR